MKHFVFGILMIVLGIWGMFAWWENFGRVMRGLLPFMLLAMGLVALLSSYYRFAEHDRGPTEGGAIDIDEEGGA
jgi:hypothetical protein